MAGGSIYRVAGLFLLGALAVAQTNSVAPNPDGIAFFEKNIRPLLADRCYGCHSSTLSAPLSGLLLDSQAGMLRGGKTGIPVIVAGKPEESLLIAAVRRVNKDLQMPPGKALDAFEIDNLAEWIKMGAPDPRTDAAPVAALPAPAYNWDKARRHWAFRPVRDPKPPQVAAPEWRQSPVDRFIKAKLDAKGLVPEPRAGKLAHSPRDIRLDGIAARAPRSGCVPEGYRTTSLRESSGSFARLPAIRRALGPALAGCSALRRHRRRQRGFSRACHVSLPELGDRRLQ